MSILNGDDGEKDVQSGLYLDLDRNDVNKIPVDVISTIRRETGGKESGIEACALVVDQGFPQKPLKNYCVYFNTHSVVSTSNCRICSNRRQLSTDRLKIDQVSFLPRSTARSTHAILPLMSDVGMN